MLIRREVLDRIVAGDVDTLFRKQKRPTVKAGGTLRTAVGILSIDEIEPIAASKITKADATRAGFATATELVKWLSSRDEGKIYRVRVSFAGADPRITLRENTDIGADELSEIAARLERLDKASKRGPWTLTFLKLIADNPHVRAPDLAESLGLVKLNFKNDVRKLKGLGLTISHSPGYEISPRGQVVLDHLSNETR